MTETLTVRIRILTPLWTGGIDGTMDRIHETGILGSLRWWYEAIVRGLGGYACDPSEHKCSFDIDKHRKSTASDERQRLRDAGLCDACQVFGATGWRRRFRLTIVEDETQPAWEPRDKALNIRPPERTRGWYLLPGRVGTFKLKLEGEEKVIALLACLFLWLEQHGSLGARPQLGYGAFRILNRNEVGTKARGWQNDNLDNDNKEHKETAHPNLRHFLFFRYEFMPLNSDWWTEVLKKNVKDWKEVKSLVCPLMSNWHMVPVTPILKNKWRFHQWSDSQSQEMIFGTLRPNRQRGRISATWAYKKNGKWVIHGWAWMPQNWAAMVWQMLTDKSVWAQVIGVSGTLTVDPSGQWRERTLEEVLRLLPCNNDEVESRDAS